MLKGGGIGQPSDPPGQQLFRPDPAAQRPDREDEGLLQRRLHRRRHRVHRGRPRSARSSPTSRSTPRTRRLQVPDRDLQPYRGLNPIEASPAVGHPLPGELPADVTARVYGDGLEHRRQRRPAARPARRAGPGPRHDRRLPDRQRPSAAPLQRGMLDRKGSVHDGGIRVPCFVRWPGTLEAGRVVDRIAAHIDLTPTLLEACGVAKPRVGRLRRPEPPAAAQGRGRPTGPTGPSSSSGIGGTSPKFIGPSRRGRGGTSWSSRRGSSRLPLPEPLHYELYDMVADPLEQEDIAEANPEVVVAMLEGYEAWFRDVGSTRNFAHPRIQLGSTAEDPTTLTRQDWRGPETAWQPGEMGGWDVNVVRPGTFDLDLVFVQGPPGAAHLDLGGTSASVRDRAGLEDLPDRRDRATQGPRPAPGLDRTAEWSGGSLSGRVASTTLIGARLRLSRRASAGPRCCRRGLDGGAHAVEHREVEVVQRRFWVSNLRCRPVLIVPPPLAGEEDRQVVVVVAVAVADAAAVDDHRVVEHVAVALADRPELPRR